MKSKLTGEAEATRRIVFFIPSLRGGGAEVSMVRLANAMAVRGMKSTLLVLERAGQWEKSVGEGVELIALGTRRASRSIVPLIRFFLEKKPDIFISNLAHLNLISTVAHRVSRSSAKLILVEHNHLKSRSIWEKDAPNRFLLMGIRWLYKRADRVLAVSEGVRQNLIQQFDLQPEQVRVLNNPIDIGQIELARKDEIDHPWFKDPNVRVVIGVGRLIYLKGWDYLIEALGIVRRGIDARLILMGEGDIKSALLAQAVELGLNSVVEIVDFQTNPYAWMASSDVFVLPSRSEGFGIALVEAMAVGVPVVASDCLSGPGEILSGGSYGLLVPVGDVQVMADSIIALLTQAELASDFQTRAAMRAQDFNIGRIAMQLSSLLDEIE